MATLLNKLILLVWKNFLLQRRHVLQTIIEILAPIIFTSLLVVIRSLVSPELHPVTVYEPFNADNVTFKSKFITIPYSPNHPELKEIIDNMVDHFQEKYPNIIFARKNFNNSKLLNDFMSNEISMLTSVAAIQFEDSLASITHLPSHMKITLRFPGELKSNPMKDWKTDKVFPIYQVPGPRDWDQNEGATPNYFKEKFLLLQQELSFSIINYFKQQKHQKSFDRENINLQMQRFPYPEWNQDDLLTALQSFVGLIVMLSFVYTCINTVKTITVEKEKQLKEAMIIMGSSNWLHWMAWFIKQYVFLFISTVIIVILLKVKWYPNTENTIFTHSSYILIFLLLQLYVTATITLCFAISVFFNKANTAATVAGLIWFLSYFPYSFFRQRYYSLSLLHKFGASLCSNTAMAYGFQIIIMLEGLEEGIQFHNMWDPANPDDNLAFGHVLIMLLIDTFIYLLIALYVEIIFPGEYGISQPWYFPFKISYWLRSYSEVNEYEEILIDNEWYENESPNLEFGIQIRNLHKAFNKKVSVKKLSLNLHKNQITVLLGHNGAGKTTTISMLTGMFPPTSGTAKIEGFDIRTNIIHIRKIMGYCPQHNILYDELTVEEHLYFYSKLKGLSKDKVNEDISKYLYLLQLTSKKNAKVANLSGGMKRKLSVGVALCGNSSIIICDEPTTGMDPASRRALWNILQQEKKNRTILLTTHYMDEADILGDRIAIMAEGNLKCYGSSFFLKKKYGIGYHLVIIKSSECNVARIIQLMQQYIPDIHVNNNVGFELTFLLKEEYSSTFESLFAALEENSGQLGISSFGISYTTLEDVFLRIGIEEEQCTQESYELSDNIINLEPNLPPLSTERVNHRFEGIPDNKTNNHLNFCQNRATASSLQAMFLKKILSTIRSWHLLLLQFVLPVIFLILAVIIYHQRSSPSNLPSLKMSLSSYKKPITTLSRNADNKYSAKYTEYLQNNNFDYINWEFSNYTEKILTEIKNNVALVRQHYIIGATFFNNSVIAWFNNQPYHSPPLSLQLVMNSILKEEVSDNHTIEIFNHPLQYTLNTQLRKLSQLTTLGFQLAFNMGFSMAFVSAFYILYYIKERVVNFKHMQFTMGVSAFPFWCVAYFCDLITFILTAIFILITLVIVDEDGFSTFDQLLRLLVIFLYFGASIIPLMYLASFFFKVPSSGYSRMSLINIFTGVAAFLVVNILSEPTLNLQHVSKILDWIFLIFPLYSMSSAIQNIYTMYFTHKLCNYFINTCINITTPILSPDECKKHVCKVQEVCCSMTNDYFDTVSPGIGRNIIISCSMGLLFIILILLYEYNFHEKFFTKFHFKTRSINALPLPESQLDEDVMREKLKVLNFAINDINNTNVVINNVTKCYKNIIAVNNLYLAIDKNECFGLLGVNGAGKTTTFKILTGDVYATKGHIWIKGFNLKKDKNQIRKLIGYCPQIDALQDDLTCRETLIIFGLLRGFSFSQCKIELTQLASKLKFQEHLDKQVKALSGGNKRKLSTAIALIGYPPIIYLDEPTAGMDPSSKRHVWNTLCDIRNKGHCIVLTSHSMEECEALCTKVAIMVQGKLMCLGSIQHLKNKFSNGYILTIKANKNTEDSIDLNLINQYIEDHFLNSTLKEVNQQLLTFRIAKDHLTWSKIFGIMENAKRILNIKEYSLTQNSLEQVFLSFANNQNEDLVAIR